VEQQWNALGALANSVLRQAAEARNANAGQLREAEAAQGEVARARRKQPAISFRQTASANAPAQLELPFA